MNKEESVVEETQPLIQVQIPIAEEVKYGAVINIFKEEIFSTKEKFIRFLKRIPTYKSRTIVLNR